MITTITMNPALDKTLALDKIEWKETNRTECIAEYAAGKGIDVAKVLSELQADTAATGFLGGDVSYIFVHLLKDRGIRNEFVKIEGSTRTNIQIFEKDGSRTEFLEKGPHVSQKECEKLEKTIAGLAEESDVVALCGSAPKGVSSEYYRSVIKTAKKHGDVVIVDASEPFLALAVEEKPDLIKPNRKEMLQLMQKEQAEDNEILDFAEGLVKDGISYVVVSVGEKGAYLICEQGCYYAMAPDIIPVSTVGCGDTMVASFCVSFQLKDTPDVMLQKAVAMSSANAMTKETAHIEYDEYQQLLKKTKTEKIR